MRTTKILCDNCNEDITTTCMRPAYRLRITCERLPNTANSEYTILVSPPIKDDLYFCGTKCLKEWAAE